MRKNFITWGFLVASTSTLAAPIAPSRPTRPMGVGSSGGGFAVVCRAPSGSIEKVELLDLFEAVNVHKLSLVRSRNHLEDDFHHGVLTYRRLGGDPRGVDDSARAHFRQITRLLVYVNDGRALPPISDTGTLPALPTGCQAEAVAVFQDRTQQIFVNRELWSRMRPLHQAALLQHEVIYSMFRTNGDKTSEIVRRVVGRLYSTEPGATKGELLSAGPNGMCSGGLRLTAHGRNWSSYGSGGPLSTIFYLVQPVGTRRSRLVFSEVLGRHILMPLSIDLPFFVDDQALKMRGVNDLLVTDPRARHRHPVTITEGPLAGFRLEVHYVYNQPLELVFFDTNGVVLGKSPVSSCMVQR